MSEENENEVADATEESVANEAEAPKSVNLALNDIVLAANIIDLATQRGAFKAAEAGQVGACFNKLVAFVKATQEAKAESEGGDNATTEEAASEEA